MEDRKIGWTDWVHLRKWHLYAVGLILMFSAGAINSVFKADWRDAVFFGSLALFGLVFTAIKMARDEELNIINGVKRFWLKFL